MNVFTLSPTARKQLIAGQVDSRLVLAIAALASKEPVDIVQFGNIGPGADADIPLRYADLAENDQAAHLAGSAYVQSMRADLGTGPVAYRPAAPQPWHSPEVSQSSASNSLRRARSGSLALRGLTNCG